MYPYRINLFLAVALVMLGLWSFQASGRDNHTLIVPALGILLSFFHRPLLNDPHKFLKIVFTFFVTTHEIELKCCRLVRIMKPPIFTVKEGDHCLENCLYPFLF